MGLLSRAIFREVAKSAIFGATLFTFVLFLQRVGKLFEILVRSSAPPATVGSSVRSRHSVHALVHLAARRALGRSDRPHADVERRRDHRHARRRRSQPQSDPARIAVCNLAMLVTATASLWLTPYSTWKTYKVLNQLVAAELTSEVQPQVFDEGFPNRILYISDVIPGAVTRWRNVFIADTTPPEEQKKTDHDRGEGPASPWPPNAIAVPDVPHNQIQLSLQDGANYDVGKDARITTIVRRPPATQILEATKPNEVHAKGYTEIDTIPLYRLAYHDKTLDHDNVIQARIELHQRLALPPACFLLALIGIPLGVSSRKGGKSGAFVVTVALAFVYWMGLIAANGLAKQQKLAGGHRHVDSERDLRRGRLVPAHSHGAPWRSRLVWRYRRLGCRRLDQLARKVARPPPRCAHAAGAGACS